MVGAPLLITVAHDGASQVYDLPYAVCKKPSPLRQTAFAGHHACEGYQRYVGYYHQRQAGGVPSPTAGPAQGGACLKRKTCFGQFRSGGARALLRLAVLSPTSATLLELWLQSGATVSPFLT